MNVSLTPELQKHVRSKLKSGGYESASEVIREGLRAMQERDVASEQFWAGARAKLAIARQQIDAAKVVNAEAAMQEILAEFGRPAPTKRKARLK